MIDTIRQAVLRRTSLHNRLPIPNDERAMLRRGVPAGTDPKATYTLERPASWYEVRAVLRSIGFKFNPDASDFASGHDHWHGFFMDSPHKECRLQLEVGLVVSRFTGYANVTVDIVSVKGARATSYITELNRRLRVCDLLDWLLITLGNQMQDVPIQWREDTLEKLRFNKEN